MGFALTYLEERALFPQKITESPDGNTGIIIVIPAFNEPGIATVLDSLSGCDVPECKVEVIIVVNAPGDSAPEVLDNNKQCILNIDSWRKQKLNCFFRLFIFDVDHPAPSGWGVGMARKTGMDEAVRRFDSIDKPGGVILNLDADCTVKKNYLTTVYDELFMKKGAEACSIYFEHPLSGTEFPDETYRYITLYELHLRYYFQGLAYTGFPWVFHTVGSAIAVKALAYIKAGGMNRKQAGEDFYFVQKLVPAGGYFSLNSTAVYPSPRSSTRVPFGTGASIGKLTAGGLSTLVTYNVLAFSELKAFFELTDLLYNCGSDEIPGYFSMLPWGIQQFIGKDEWISKMGEIKGNTSNIISFKKRFFGWFNMFRVVKYMNFISNGIFPKEPVDISASKLLMLMGFEKFPVESHELLLYFRSLEQLPG
jgi:hypothetical protein